MSKWPYNTQRWQRLRRHKLRACPVCEACFRVGLTEPAVAVDHRTPIKRGGDPFPHLDQLASLCEGCHNEKLERSSWAESPLPKASRGATCTAIRLIQIIRGIGHHDLTQDRANRSAVRALLKAYTRHACRRSLRACRRRANAHSHRPASRSEAIFSWADIAVQAMRGYRRTGQRRD